MKATEIRNFLENNPITSKCFLGVLSYELLPIITDDEQCSFFVVNTDQSEGNGKHWVVIFKEKGKYIEFFDPLAKTPESYSIKLQNYLLSHSSKYFISCKRIQGNEPVCGNYCLIYAYLRCQGLSMKVILNQFSNNLYYNDELVKF